MTAPADVSNFDQSTTGLLVLASIVQPLSLAYALAASGNGG